MLSDLQKRTDELNLEAWKLRYSDLEASRIAAESALSQSEELDYKRGKAYASLNLAVNNFYRSGNRKALELCYEVLPWFKDNPDEVGYASTLTYMANIFESLGDYERAMDLIQKGIQVAEKINNKESLGEAQSVLGLIHIRLGDYDSAMTAYQKGLEIREEQGDQLAVASSLNRIARAHTLKKQYEKALEQYEKSLAIREKHLQKGAIPWTLLGLASTYEDMSVLEQAEEYYKKTLSYSENYLDDRCRLQAGLGLGRVLQRVGQQKNALDHYLSSLDLANTLDAKALQIEAHEALAGYYESTGAYDQALHHYKFVHEIREQVLNDETRNRLKNQEIAFAVEKSEREKEIYQLRNVELKSALEQIKKKNTEIAQSIEYASRIQHALLPGQVTMSESLPDHFLLFMPRDVVSGDFYWYGVIDQQVIFAVADCTGHGVPGALMSMLGISFMNDIVMKQEHTDPGQILNILRNEVIHALDQKGIQDEQMDGMDIALCAFNPDKLSLKYAGAYNPLYLVRQRDMQVFPANRMSISYPYGDADNFQTHTISLCKGDMLYLFSDGFPDQVGGPKRKKFKYNKFRELLQSISEKDLETQKHELHDRFLSWKGDEEQYDDVVILGIRI